ncbi:MAG: histidine phosphatase family protein [Pseudomonadota bacterium]
MADGSTDKQSYAPIIIARHGKPALDRNAGPRLSWEDYVDWWARYEAGSLAEGQTAPQGLIDAVKDADILLTSIRPRAQETMASARPNCEPQSLPLFNEAPLPPPRWRKARLLPKRWNVIARIAWFFGHSLGDETVEQSKERASEAARYLHDQAAHGKVFLAAHGWFNRMIRKELRAMGWRVVHDEGDRYWGYRKYVYRD